MRTPDRSPTIRTVATILLSLLIALTIGTAVYAAILAVSLFTILLSGFLMALGVPKYRKMALAAALAGIGLFIAMVSTS